MLEITLTVFWVLFWVGGTIFTLSVVDGAADQLSPEYKEMLWKSPAGTVFAFTLAWPLILYCYRDLL